MRRELAVFTSPPEGESPLAYVPYRRRMWQCQNCGHVTNHHGLDLEHVYEGAYREAAYGDIDSLRENFERIMQLPPERSDNRQRVLRIDRYFEETRAGAKKLLDVGSGLGVFPAAMIDKGWVCTALDPDPVAIGFMTGQGIRGMVGGFLEMDIPEAFSLITFNKILEHVPDMVPMLQKAASLLSEGGLIYVEVPDAEGALNDPDGVRREEFFIEHFCAPTPASLLLLARQAGLEIELLEKLREPSGKYTTRAFAHPAAV